MGISETPSDRAGIRTGAEILDLAERSKITYEVDFDLSDKSPKGAAILERIESRPGDLSGRPRITRVDSNVSLGEWTCSEDAEAHLVAAEVHFNARNYGAARAGYLEAVASDPQCYVAHSHIGDTFMQDDNDTMAIVHYNRAIELNPLDHKTFAYRGRAHLRQGEGMFALGDFRSSLTLRPHYWLTVAILENSPQFPVIFNDLRLLPPVHIEPVDKKTISVQKLERGHESWIPYALCKAVWFGEGLATAEEEATMGRKALRRERKRRARAREENGTQFDYGEEFECVMLALENYMATKEGASSTPPTEFTSDPSLEALEKALRAGHTTEALLYGIAAQRFGQTMLMLGEELRQQMRTFVDEMVLYPEEESR